MKKTRCSSLALVLLTAAAVESRGSAVNVGGVYHPEKSACVSTAKTDAEAEKEVRACFEEADKVILEENDPRIRLAYRRDRWANDRDLLIFLERRQIFGWEGLEAYYHLIVSTPIAQTDAAGRRKNRLELTNTNVRVKARGGMAFVAANRDESEIDAATGEKDTDSMRTTEIFERRNGRWVAVHEHASFQAPRGPQRPVPLATDPSANMWDPVLHGAWRAEGDGFLIASESSVAVFGVPGLPARAAYRYEPKTKRLLLTAGTSDKDLALEVEDFTATRLTFRIPGQAKKWVWRRTEW